MEIPRTREKILAKGNGGQDDSGEGPGAYEVKNNLWELQGHGERLGGGDTVASFWLCLG